MFYLVLTFYLKKKKGCYPKTYGIPQEIAKILPQYLFQFTFERILERIDYKIGDNQSFVVYLKFGYDRSPDISSKVIYKCICYYAYYMEQQDNLLQ